MEPIVSPWLIYIIFQINSLKGIFAFVGILGSVAGMFLIMFAYTPPEVGRLKLPSILSVLFFGSVIFVSAMLPSQKTLIAMYAANEITLDRVEKSIDIATDTGKALKGEIIEIIESVTCQTENVEE